VAALFISDLHLSATRPEVVRLFLEFLSGPARRAEALYILGDLFDYWAGDDDLDDPFNSGIVTRLADTAAAGTRVHFMRGNRDFLAGDRFAEAAHTTLLEDPSEVALYGSATLLTHGDQLCTDDAAYQAFRRQVREPAWIDAFLARPLEERKREIERLHSRSEAEKRRKSADIMDVNADAVAALLRRHGSTRLVHGHTHRQAQHVHRVGERDCERWVLPDWHGPVDVLVVDERGARFEPAQ
jgi:UDP-2,3-diacylglucosamine hydrolase